MLGTVHRSKSQFQEAEACYSELQNRLDASDPKYRETEEGRRRIAEVVIQLGRIALARGRQKLAEEKFGEACVLLRTLTSDYALNPAYTLDLADCLYHRSQLARKDDKAQAAKFLEEATKIMEGLVVRSPKNENYISILDNYLAALKEVDK